MKKGFLSIVGFCFSVAVHAQIWDSVFVLPKVGGHEFALSPLLIPGAKILTENKAEKVYALPINHMPCLVSNPKNTIPIPTKKLFLQKGSIPNSSPK